MYRKLQQAESDLEMTLEKLEVSQNANKMITMQMKTLKKDYQNLKDKNSLLRKQNEAL